MKNHAFQKKKNKKWKKCWKKDFRYVRSLLLPAKAENT